MDVETLVRDPEAAAADQAQAAPEAGGAPPETPVERPCPSCGAPLQPDQDWCLECGNAAGDGRRLPGWRTAAAVLAIALVLASGAVAAAYAAMNSSSESGSTTAAAPQTTAQAAPPATPSTPDLGAAPAEGTSSAPPAAAPSASTATPPPATPPAPTPPVSSSATPPPVAPPAATPPASATPSTGGSSGTGSGPSGSSSSGSTSGSGTSHHHASGDGTAPPEKVPTFAPVELDGATATPFDPSGQRPPTDFPDDPANAIDGDPTTAWTVQLTTPQEIATPAVGLLVDLGKPTALRRMRLDPLTPGTTVEVYGTRKAHPPTNLDDKAWTRLATQLDVDGKSNINLGDGTDDYRQIVVWFSEGPVDDSPSVGIRELKLYT